MAERPQLSIVRYRKGMYIVLVGNRDTERFFIIQSGTVQSSKGGVASVFDPVTKLNPGDFFGVVASMAQKSQIETVQAMSDVTLVAVERNQFEGLIQFNTPVAMKIIQQFSRTIRYLNNGITEVTTQLKNASDDQGKLFDVAEYYRLRKKYRIALYAYKRFAQCYPQSPVLSLVSKQIAALVIHEKPNYCPGASPFLRHYAEESPVFLEGETGDELFIIQTGSVKIIKVVNNEEVILALLKPGDIFGEMAILESKPRSANAIAFENTTLMVVQKRNFEGMTATQPQIISRLTRLLAERIWFGYKQIENAAIKDPVGRCFDYLLIQLERNNVQIMPRVSFTFSFSAEDLAKMASVHEQEIRTVIRELLQNEKISLMSDNRLFVSDVSELAKQSDFYKKTQSRSALRK